MSTLETHLNNVRIFIFKHPAGKKYGELIEEKTKINAEYFAVAILAIVAGLLFNGLGAKFISNVIGFTYPVYASLRAIETKDKGDDTQWLIYWVVFATFCLLENFVDYIKFWIPFYYPLKVSFLLWCMLPSYNGANVLYENGIKPVFLKHSSAVDEALNSFFTSKSTPPVLTKQKSTSAAAVPEKKPSTAAAAVPTTTPSESVSEEVEGTKTD